MKPVACLAAIVAFGLAILLPSALAAADEGSVAAPSGNATGQVPHPPQDTAACSILSEQGQHSRPVLMSGLAIWRDQTDPSLLVVTASIFNDKDTAYVVDRLCVGHFETPAIFEGGPPLGFLGPEISDEYLVFTPKATSLEPGDSLRVEFILRESNWEPGTFLSLTWVGESDSVLTYVDLVVPRPIPPKEPTPTPTEEPTDATVVAPTDKSTTPAPDPAIPEPIPTESSSPSSQPTLGPCYPAWWPTCESLLQISTEEPTQEPTHPTPTPTVPKPPSASPTSPTTAEAPSAISVNDAPVLVILPATSRPTAAPSSLETDVAVPTPRPSSAFAPVPPSPDLSEPSESEHPIAAAVASPIATLVWVLGIVAISGSGLIVIRRVGVPKV